MVQYNQDTVKPPAEGYPTEADKTAISDMHGSPMRMRNKDDHTIQHGQLDEHPTRPPNNPFIVDPGNGPRVKNMDAFLSAFFCPPISMDDADCELFSRGQIVSVLESVLPREVALVSNRLAMTSATSGRLGHTFCILRSCGSTRQGPMNVFVRRVNEYTASGT